MKTYPPTRFSTSCLVFLCSLVGCSQAPQWTGSVETGSGIEVVSNPGEPLLGETAGLARELWEVQGSNWVNPSRVHVQSGLITVVDPRANQVHVVTTSGGERESLGHSGGGPGEFLQLLDAFRDGDRLLITLRAFRVDLPESLFGDATQVLDAARQQEIRHR